MPPARPDSAPARSRSCLCPSTCLRGGAPAAVASRACLVTWLLAPCLVTRAQVRLEDGSVSSLKHANVILPVHTRVTVGGLSKESALRYNGRVGEVMEVDRAAQRYVVQLSETQSLKLKWENCKA